MNLATALVPSDTACLASSPGTRSQVAVWISLDWRVTLLLIRVRRPASLARRWKMSLLMEFMTDIAREDMVQSGWTSLRTLWM